MASIVAIAPLAACGGGPAGPSTITGVAAPTPAPAPEGPLPPAGGGPPPTSSTVDLLAVLSATPVAAGFTVHVEGSPLGEVWGSARTQVARDGIVRDVLLMRTGSDTFTALSGVCTHEGCVVSRVARPVFVCPCHGSRYDHTGAVVQGPAPAALPQYATEFADGVLTVRL